MIGWINPFALRLAANSAMPASLNDRRGWWGFGWISLTGSSRGFPFDVGDGFGSVTGSAARAGGGGATSTSAGSSDTEMRLLRPRPSRDFVLAGGFDTEGTPFPFRKGD